MLLLDRFHGKAPSLLRLHADEYNSSVNIYSPGSSGRSPAGRLGYGIGDKGVPCKFDVVSFES